MEVKVLGPGCAKCKTTFQVIEKVIKENKFRRETYKGGRYYGNDEL